MRKFEFTKDIPESAYRKLPERSTKHSAGYDFYVAEDTVVPPSCGWACMDKPTMVKTYVKAYMEDDEVLLVYNRSSNPIKKGLVLACSVGVVDSDYVDNQDNEGNIGFAYYNVTQNAIVLKAGEKLGQGVFTKFLTVDDDNASGERTSGFGSTGK